MRTDEPAGTPQQLVERARAAGLAVELTVTGDARALDVTVGRAAYRIVQEALTDVARHAGPAKVSVRLEHEDVELTTRYVFEALRAGASGFLLKDTEPADLLQAVEVVASGEALLSPSATRILIGEFVARPPDRSTPPGLKCLTRREREVTALAARGLTNEEIADHMVTSPFTAKTHISRAMTKPGARDRTQLVVFAYESGLVTARGQ
ncbi:LuxR C-terminal-related transcriptional regulator [Streptomyces sp. NPDC020731]|uniref:LuxR C-terminal-related transcriptional regulator n=1 Tax=Streptomyces sp. NPDC020731 TaxID=3365085 RepID=UPI0037B5D05F